MRRFCLNLTDEKMFEISHARERLMAYKRKIQPYDYEDIPQEPEPPSELPEVKVIVKHHYIYPQRPKAKPSGYKGIK